MTEALERMESMAPMSAQDVLRQVIAIQEVMKAALKEDVHYGKIPGCGSANVLLKAGAEKIAMMFRLAPSYVVVMRDLGNGHREYEVTTTMIHAQTGTILGSGVGSAATTETKWRYRWENTEQEVPKEYWQGRDPAVIGGSDYVPRKVRNENGTQTWMVFHRVPHDNPSDYYNTVLKIAKKRSCIDATLTVTAASDVFQQDLDDLYENGVIDMTPQDEGKGKGKRKPMTQPQAKDEPTPTEGKPTAGNGAPTTVNTLTLATVLANVATKNKRTYGKATDDNWYSTFDEKVGKTMMETAGKPVSILYKITSGEKGDLRTVVSIALDDKSDNVPFK
jgi:hypothetical protein